MLATRLTARIAARVPRNVVFAIWQGYWEVAAEYAEEARKKGTAETRGTTESINRADAMQVLGIAPEEEQALDEKAFMELVQERWAKMHEINAPDAGSGEGGSPYLQAIINNSRNSLVGSVMDPLLQEEEEEGLEVTGMKEETQKSDTKKNPDAKKGPGH
jgi:hypothetical protein